MTRRRLFPCAGALLLAACSAEPNLPHPPATGPQPPAAAKLRFTIQPSNATAGVPISPAVAVAIQDASGNTVTSAADAVQIVMGNNASERGSLLGTTSVSAVNGVATFSDLSILERAPGTPSLPHPAA